jgi:hypothetical protein
MNLKQCDPKKLNIELKRGLMEWLKKNTCLPSKCETLSSNPSVAKKKKS